MASQVVVCRLVFFILESRSHAGELNIEIIDVDIVPLFAFGAVHEPPTSVLLRVFELVAQVFGGDLHLVQHGALARNLGLVFRHGTRASARYGERSLDVVRVSTEFFTLDDA